MTCNPAVFPESDIHIRVAEPSDAAAIHAIYAPFCMSSAVTFEEIEPGVEEIARRIKTVSAMYPWLVAQIGSQVAGYAYANRFRERASYRWAVEIGVYVHANYYRCGVASRLYRTLLGVLKRQGFRHVLAGITLPNEPSVRLHEQFGFVKAAHYPNLGFKLQQWHDVGFWQLDLMINERQGGISPAEPLAFPELQQTSQGDWLQSLADHRNTPDPREGVDVHPALNQ